MAKVDAYRESLRALPADAWDADLLRESGLPGPRGNLELMQAVADAGDADRFARYAALTATVAPTGTADEFLPCCGVVGLGRLLAEGQVERIAELRRHAADPRWRVREAVAMALQRVGDVDIERLLAIVGAWSTGTPFEQRAATAAICEPRLLRRADVARAALVALDAITATVPGWPERRADDVMALRKGLGYGWSVAIAALPAEGRPYLERWSRTDDPDIRWIVRENLRKHRLVRIDPAWVAAVSRDLDG